MTWQPLPPSVAEWMGMDEAPDSSTVALGSTHVDPAVVTRTHRPLVDLSPLIDPLQAWLARRRTAI